MDKTQYEIAMAVADLDCEATKTLRRLDYMDDQIKFCIIGGLYATLNPDWAVHGDNVINPSTNIMGEVQDAFGLSHTETMGLIQINDNARRVTDRRMRIKAALGRRFLKHNPSAKLTPVL